MSAFEKPSTIVRCSPAAVSSLAKSGQCHPFGGTRGRAPLPTLVHALCTRFPTSVHALCTPIPTPGSQSQHYSYFYLVIDLCYYSHEPLHRALRMRSTLSPLNKLVTLQCVFICFADVSFPNSIPEVGKVQESHSPFSRT
eukprot:jgi/Botrbrau1/21276/Bobra.39_2s0065.1